MCQYLGLIFGRHPVSTALSFQLHKGLQLSALHAYICLPLRGALAAIIVNKQYPHAGIRDFFASFCFYLLDSAPVLHRAPPPGKRFTGVGSLWPVGPPNKL
jgi:hypothetical protein